MPGIKGTKIAKAGINWVGFDPEEREEQEKSEPRYVDHLKKEKRGKNPRHRICGRKTEKKQGGWHTSL